MKRGWQTRTLAEVCQIKPPKSEARDLVASDTPVSFAPMEDLGIDRKFLKPRQTKPISSVVGSYTYFADGDVLLAKITPCFENGKLGIATSLKNGIGFGSSEFVVFRPCTELNNEYLYYYLSRPEFREEGAARMAGAVGQQRIPREFVESYPIPLPPLPEQRRIVRILDEAFAGIATAKTNAEKNLENARAIFESHLNAVFTKRGRGWVEKKLEDAADSDCSLSYGIVQPGDEFDDGMPIVRPTDLTTKVIHLSGLKRIDPKLAGGYKRTALQGGELLLCVRGSTGIVSIASSELAGANVTRGIVPIRFNRSLLMPEFGFYLISAGPVQNQIRAKTYGTALMQINIRDLRVVSLSIPPVNEQRTIAAKLDSIYNETLRLAAIYKRELAAMEALKKSLLHQAFSGGL